jgi:hypothetical protein
MIAEPLSFCDKMLFWHVLSDIFAYLAFINTLVANNRTPKTL